MFVVRHELDCSNSDILNIPRCFQASFSPIYISEVLFLPKPFYTLFLKNPPLPKESFEFPILMPKEDLSIMMQIRATDSSTSSKYVLNPNNYRRQ
jgi:hypothetical protein